MALYEDTVYDERLGRIVNNNLAEYHVPTNMDVGTTETLWVNEEDMRLQRGEPGILGSKGTALRIGCSYRSIVRFGGKEWEHVTPSRTPVACLGFWSFGLLLRR